jgi:hypothetical protein
VLLYPSVFVFHVCLHTQRDHRNIMIAFGLVVTVSAILETFQYFGRFSPYRLGIAIKLRTSVFCLTREDCTVLSITGIMPAVLLLWPYQYLRF